MKPDSSVLQAATHPAVIRVVGGLVGAGTLGFLGAVAGIFFPLIALDIMSRSVVAHGGSLDKPGAGWMFLFTVPLGAIMGAVAGAIVGATSPTWPALGLRVLLGAVLLLVVLFVVCLFAARGALA